MAVMEEPLGAMQTKCNIIYFDKCISSNSQIVEILIIFELKPNSPTTTHVKFMLSDSSPMTTRVSCEKGCVGPKFRIGLR